MKRRLQFIPVLLFTLLFTLAGGAFQPAFGRAQGRELAVLVDGLPVTFDVQPVIREGRTLVPFRALAAALNVEVSWDGSTQTVGAAGQGITIRLQIGSKTAYRNEVPMALDVPPQLLNGRTLIPLRFFSEAFACQVDWDEATYSIRILSPPADMTVTGFYALGDSRTSSWRNLFGRDYPEKSKGNTDVVDELALGWYSLDAEGNLLTQSRTGWQRPDGWEKVLAAAREYGLKTEMVVHLTDKDGIIASLLNNNTAMDRAAAAIVTEAKLYQGVNLDFEGLGYQDEGEKLAAVRASFNRFVRLLAARLQAGGLNLTLTLHAPNSVYKGYDYRTLGELADRIIIMAYDYGTRPEPVNLVIQAVEMAGAAVPPDKLILGISVPNETPESIVAKVGIVKRYKLQGVALWRLGLVPAAMWDELRKMIK